MKEKKGSESGGKVIVIVYLLKDGTGYGSIGEFTLFFTY